MVIRIVSANQNKVRFYDIDCVTGPLQRVGELEDPTARLHDRDLKSERPGILYSHAPPASGRRGGVAHSGTGGERRPRKHAAEVLCGAHRPGVGAASPGRSVYAVGDCGRTSVSRSYTLCIVPWGRKTGRGRGSKRFVEGDR